MGPAASSNWKPGKMTTARRRFMAGTVGTMAFRPNPDRRTTGSSTRPKEPPMSKLQIVIALYPGVTHLDFTGPHQVLVRTPGAEVVVASMGGQDIVAEGLTFTGLADLRRVIACDVLLVPGGMGTTDAMLDEAFMAEIRRLGEQARYLTSVCTGSLILAAAGFLAGKRAACHWAWRDLLTPFGAIVSEA